MRNFIADIIFWLHAVVLLFWWGLFFVPTGMWASKISFHFFFTVGIVGHQFLWGAMTMPWTKKYQMTCILTTIMQWVRGEKLSDERNYRHVWTKEFFRRAGWGLPERGATIVTAIISTIVTIQYSFFR
ncbi:hypothetical protein IID24_03800 [Patescibacteria group bacterium]|nr:hypothetical protein [Patescibacteria group bacterium]